MGAVPAQILVCRTWFPPDVYGVRGYSGKRPRWVRQPFESTAVIDRNKLRIDLRNRRKVFGKDRVFSFDAPPTALIGAFREPGIVGGYVKTGSEVDPLPILANIADEGGTIALPALADRNDAITFRLWSPDDPLVLSPFGFLQPLHSAPACAPHIVLTPLLGFDRGLNRLGQGGGHYDRAFAAHPEALRVGLAWSVQECPALPVEPWDMPLDAVWTEKEWITAPQSRIGRS